MSRVIRTVTFTVNKEHSIADQSSGTDSGNSGDNHAPIGTYNGWTWRELLRASLSFGTAPEGGWQFIDCELWVKTTTDVHVNTGGSPRVRISRLNDASNGAFTASGGGENSWGSTYGTVWPGPVLGSGQVLMPIQTGAQGAIVKYDISDIFEDLIPSTMRWRDNSTHTQLTNNGFRVESANESTTPSTSEFYSMRGAYAPRFVVRYYEGTLPPGPILTGPSGVVSAAPTSFTATAQELPCVKYAIDVGTDPTFAGGILWSASGLTAGIAGAAITATYAGIAQPVGVPIYWRMRTANDIGNGIYGDYSASGTYTIGAGVGTAVITYPIADGNARISNLTEEVEWTTGGLHAKPEVTWRFNDTAGRDATRIIVRLYDDLLNLQFTDTIDGTFPANTDLTLATLHPVVRATFMRISITPYVGPDAQTASGNRRFKCQWGQGQYTCAPGAAATGHRFVYDALTPAATEARVAFLHRFRDGAVTAPWKSTITGTVRTNWDVLVRLGTRSTMPALPQMQMFWTAAAATPPDQWFATGCALDLVDSFRRFGVKSLRVITQASTQGIVFPKPDPNAIGVIVSEKTEYTFSVYINTLTALAGRVRLAIRDVSGTIVWDPELVVGTDPDASTLDSRTFREGWQRLFTTFTTPEGAQRIVPIIICGGGVSEEFRLDAAQLEEGSYASLWTPGMLGPQVILDKGGFQVDAVKGGNFRLKASANGIRDVIELWQHGLRFASDTELSSPSAGNLAINGAVIAKVASAPVVKIITAPGAGTWNPGAGMTYADVEVIGGGGGSGGVSVTAAGERASAAGGGGGGYSKKRFTAAALGASQNYVVGTAGAAGAAGNNNGGTGGTTTFGAAPLLQATGGVGGDGGPASSSGTGVAQGGDAGVGTLGDINLRGQGGGNSFTNAAVRLPQGFGGGTQYGYGPRASAASSPAIAGTGYGYGVGAAGGNSNVSTAAAVGAVGAPGAIIVTEYYT